MEPPKKKRRTSTAAPKKETKSVLKNVDMNAEPMDVVADGPRRQGRLEAYDAITQLF